MVKHRGHQDVIEELYNQIPAFTDIFTEESFYMFAICFAIGTIGLAIILSRYVTIKPYD